MPQDRFTITNLAEGKSALVQITPVSIAGGLPVLGSPIRGIGLGIESVTTFPEVENYLEHEFYRNNFTPSEIDYCSKQPSARSSFCELWAAKQAVVKSGAGKGSPDCLSTIEISCDETGKPSHPNCFISVGHSDTTVVAVCIWTQGPGDLPTAPTSAPGWPPSTLASLTPAQRFGMRVFMAFVALSLLFVFGAGLWFIMNMTLR